MGEVAQTLLAAINKDRARHQLPALGLDRTQSACSKKHSQHMARLGELAHDQFPADVCVRHGWAGENVGVAYGDPTQAVRTLHTMMMDEGPCPHKGCPGDEFEAHGHYLNLVNSHFKRLGIGLYVKDGSLWLTENFVD